MFLQKYHTQNVYQIESITDPSLLIQLLFGVEVFPASSLIGKVGSYRKSTSGSLFILYVWSLNEYPCNSDILMKMA
jgi:hypothetical protein